MHVFKLIAVVALGLGASACTEIEQPSRNIAANGDLVPSTIAAAATSERAAQAVRRGQSPVTVKAIRVEVPRTLSVSEANSYYPSGDIVWREDPLGDRHAQVKKIVYDGLSAGTRSLNGPMPVILDIRVRRFHALSEKARYTTGGVHNIHFDIAVRDANTQELLVQPRFVQADLDAFGGSEAIIAEARGQTQKKRIQQHLAAVIQQELTDPEGHKNANLGLIQAINHNF